MPGIKHGETAIEILGTIAEMQRRATDIRKEGKTIAFVPTMGYLHEGHLSLVKRGKEAADILVASIFVNPEQFGPDEDLSRYPRDPENDIRLAETAGVDILFMPEAPDLYPEGYETYVVQTDLPEHLCGLSRPVFFRGVMTIVAKLFNIVKPHLAIFGEKDYQQLAVIRKMTRDLNFDTEIIGGPTLRESDGLAMSSRNKYLSEDDRKSARVLYRCLSEAGRRVAEGETIAGRIIAESETAIRAEPDTEIDYIKICHPGTLNDVAVIDQPVVMALAVKVGGTRLIDNLVLFPPGTGEK